MQPLILAIDQGTTGSTALIFDSELNVLGKANVEFPQYFPKTQWVEHDLNEIWLSVCQAVQMALEQCRHPASAIAAVGITNQRETTCLWERDAEATPVGRAIVWQDRRTNDFCQKLRKRGLEKTIRRKTGLVLDPYFSGTKLNWMLKNYSGARKRAQAGELAFGTIDSYLLYRLTGEHKTEPTNACRTLLMNLKNCQWDPELLKIFQIPQACLPQIHPSSGSFGKTKNFPGLPDGIPVLGIAGDQQAALFGQACFKKGSAKSTYGTGAFVLVNTGDVPKMSRHKLLTSVAWQIGNKTTYCIEGSAFVAGAAVQWLRDQLGLIKSSPEIEKLAAEVESSEGVFFVPGMAGLGAPHWTPTATGMLTGITRGTSKAHIARAVLEGIAYQVAELITAMGKDLGSRVSPLKVDGGASQNGILMQTQADLLGVPVVRSKIVETTALGSGLLAGLAAGIWKNTKEIEKQWQADETYVPAMKASGRKAALERWERVIKAVQLLS